MVEDNEGAELKSAVEYGTELQKKVFPDLKVGIIHGKMKPAEKDRVMAEFVSGDTDILVATTVIEVGVDVPNATVMVVENADRFGLSQLHQLRGRVGRGEHKSYCILFNTSGGENAGKRLKIMCGTNDGFKIAEEDLKLRGQMCIRDRGDTSCRRGGAPCHGAKVKFGVYGTERGAE